MAYNILWLASDCATICSAVDRLLTECEHHGDAFPNLGSQKVAIGVFYEIVSAITGKPFSLLEGRNWTD